VRVGSVAADRKRTVARLVATAGPPFRFVRALGGFRLDRHLILRGDQGSEYSSQPPDVVRLGEATYAAAKAPRQTHEVRVVELLLGAIHQRPPPQAKAASRLAL
jgi:hypothetical protein